MMLKDPQIEWCARREEEDLDTKLHDGLVNNGHTHKQDSAKPEAC